MAEMTPEQIVGVVSLLVKDAENYRDELSKERDKAMEYYDGEMRDVSVEDNRSKVVSRDVRSQIKKALPSIMRTILGNDKVVEYEPVGEGDEEAAEQATDYINYVVFPESDGYEAVQDAVFDAMLLRNGIIRWWYDKRIQVSVSKHTGLSEDELTQLVSDDNVDVLEQNTYQDQVQTPEGFAPQTFYDVKIRRRETRGCNKLAAVPPEEFLCHPDALDLDISPLVGINKRLRRSDLVSMGYDKDKIDSLPIAGKDMDQEDEETTRRREVWTQEDSTQRALQEIDYYELFVRVDADGDGIAELRRMVFAGGLKVDNLLDNEEWDEIQFADIICERRPHQREGNSVADDMVDIQRIKTVLLRQTMDNLYWQNNAQPIVQEGVVQNPSSVLKPKFGEPIRVTQGTPADQAVKWNIVPFVAEKSFAMLEYLDREATDRTGISDASSGLPPDALQNVTAKASAMMEQAGIGQTELMVRTIAHGLKRMFKGILQLTIKHQDQPRVVRLRDKWVTFDPRQWNSGMDATVNTGLGAGTRERDMMMMQMIINLQEKLLTALGPDNPFVSPENVYNAIAKAAESAGAKSPDIYFTKPTPEDIQARKEAAANAPNPEVQKVQIKAEADKQSMVLKAQFDDKKLAQEGDLERARIAQDGELKRYQIDKEAELKRQQNAIQVLTREPVTTTQFGGQAG